MFRMRDRSSLWSAQMEMIRNLGQGAAVKTVFGKFSRPYPDRRFMSTQKTVLSCRQKWSYRTVSATPLDAGFAHLRWPNT